MLRSKSGISLVEILVAMMILGFGISMVMRTLPESNTITSRARNITKATNLVQEKLEQLINQPFGDPVLAQGLHADPENPIERDFRRSWVVQDDNPYAGMKRVSVRVSFPTASADSSVSISSVISSRW